jgi:hypothetical protein
MQLFRWTFTEHIHNENLRWNVNRYYSKVQKTKIRIETKVSVQGRPKKMRKYEARNCTVRPRTYHQNLNKNCWILVNAAQIQSNHRWTKDLLTKRIFREPHRQVGGTITRDAHSSHQHVSYLWIYCCSCRWVEMMSLNWGHQRAYCSTAR